MFRESGLATVPPAEGGAKVGAGRPVSVGNRALLIIFAMLMLASAWPGADFSRYADWANSAFEGDLWDAATYTISPLGVPIMMWSHGSGFVYATGNFFLQPLGDLRLSAMVTGWLAALLFWAAMLRVIWTLSDRSLSLTIFCAGATALGTHAGYFSNTHASESLALACAAVLVWLVVEEDEPRLLQALTAGLAIGFLVTIKSYWAIYAVPSVLVLAWRAHRRRLPPARLIAIFVVFALPVVVGLTQTALTNRWMTGSPLQSSYIFGDEQFDSFNFREPELAAVVIHPLHGLLSHHPFYGLAFVALLAMIAAPGRAEQRLFFALGAVAVIVNLFFQAAWVVWWLGNATFGMRGMALATTVVIPPFVIVLRRTRKTRPRLFAAICAVTFACCFWSFLLLLEGSSRFHTFAEMLSAQQYAFRAFWGSAALTAAIAAMVIVAVNRRLFRRSAAGVVTFNAAGCAMVALWITYMALRISERPISESGSLGLAGLAAAAVLSVAAIILQASFAALHRRTATTPRSRLIDGLGSPITRFATAVATVVFVVMAFLFFGLARQVEEEIALGRPPRRNFAWVNTFSIRDMKDSCNEYRRVPGFDKKRDEFKQFLIRQGVDPVDFRF